MPEFSICFTEPAPFQNRSKSSLSLILVVCAAITGFWLLVTNSGNWKYVGLMGVFLLLVQYLKAANHDKHFISGLKIGQEQVSLKYTEKGVPKSVSGSKKQFVFRKKIAFNKTRTPYLAVYYKGALIVGQYQVGEWTEEQFDQVLEAMQ